VKVSDDVLVEQEGVVKNSVALLFALLS